VRKRVAFDATGLLLADVSYLMGHIIAIKPVSLCGNSESGIIAIIVGAS